jgi:hypothetical protein
MTLDELITTLRDHNAALYVEDGQLRYVGPRLAADDPIRRAIAAHRSELVELFTYMPGGRCVFTDCYRLLAEGDKICCPDHRRRLDALPAPWEAKADDQHEQSTPVTTEAA